MIVQITATGLVLIGCRYAEFGFDRPHVVEGVAAGYTGVVPRDSVAEPVIEVRVEPGTLVSLYALSDDYPSQVERRTFVFEPGADGGSWGDMDGNGAIDVHDLLAFLAGFRAMAADVNGDGQTNVEDLLAYLGIFRSGTGDN